MSKTREILLGTIILGLIVNLLGNAVWKYLPDSKVHPHTYVVATVVLVAMCILHLLSAHDGLTKGSLTKIWKAFLPSKTLTFVPNVRSRGSHWGGGETRGERAMYASSEWYVTNVSNGPMQILRAYLVKPRTEASMLMTQHPEEEVFGDYPILPGSMSQVHVSFFIVPPFRREGETFGGKIIFVDQLNKKHKVKVRFGSYSEDGELVLSIKPTARWRNQLDRNHLQNAIRKKLNRKKVFLSQNLTISTSKTFTEWEIRNPNTPDLVYIAKFRDKELHLYKRFITNLGRQVMGRLRWRNVEDRLILSFQPSPKCREEFDCNRVPPEVKEQLEKKGELLSNNANVSKFSTSEEWKIKDAETPRLLYTAKVEDNELNLYKRFIRPPRQAPQPARWTQG